MVKNKSFTLIELLVVIAIIGLLFSIALLSLSLSQAKARDTRRIADLRQFVTALELFHSTYEIYPCGDIYVPSGPPRHADGSSSCPFLDGNAGSVSDPNYNGCDPPHMNNAACTDEPTFGLKTAGLIGIYDLREYPYSQGANTYYYIADPTRQKYILAATLEVNTDAMQNDGGLCDNIYEFGNAVGDPNVMPPCW